MDDDQAAVLTHQASFALEELVTRAPVGRIFDFLVEGNIQAFVRLPTSFDCLLTIPQSYWRRVDFGPLSVAITTPAEAAIFRLPLTDVMAFLSEALAAERITPFNEWEAQTTLTTLVYHASGAEPAFGGLEDDEAPSETQALKALRHEFLDRASHFARPAGYGIFVESADAEELFAPSARPNVVGKARGPRPRDGWVVIWEEIARGFATKDNWSIQRIAGEAHARAEKRVGKQILPAESTVYNRLTVLLADGDDHP